MIIDFHTHIYPSMVAAKILPAAERKLKVDVPGSGQPLDLIGHMSRSGIKRSVLLPLAKGREDVSSLNDWVLSVSKDGLIPFGAIHPFMENLEEELDRLAACGVRGVKIMPLLQEFYPDDQDCERLYEGLIKRDMILVTHTGRDPLEREEIFGTPDRFARVVQRFPDLRLGLAHLGGMRMWDEAREHLLPAGGNVYFDTAYVSFYLDRLQMRELIQDIGADRVIFGSDYPWEVPGRAAEIIQGLDLSEEENEAIFWRNASLLLK